MKLNIILPDYDGDALDFVIERNTAYYSVEKQGDDLIIHMNRAFMKSFAYQMLYFIESPIEAGSHVHYDSFCCPRMHGKHELMICKNDEDDFSVGLLCEPKQV